MRWCNIFVAEIATICVRFEKLLHLWCDLDFCVYEVAKVYYKGSKGLGIILTKKKVRLMAKKGDLLGVGVSNEMEVEL